MHGSPNDPEVPKNLLNVRRNHVFLDSIRKILSASYNHSIPISVKFADDLGVSEGAVDLGGPAREFLRLAVKEIYTKHGLFRGADERKVLLLNSVGNAV